MHFINKYINKLNIITTLRKFLELFIYGNFDNKTIIYIKMLLLFNIIVILLIENFNLTILLIYLICGNCKNFYIGEKRLFLLYFIQVLQSIKKKLFMIMNYYLIKNRYQ
ncbi:hypothetical protein EDEG_03140 [Edhazardia aedis USNM 41457]|uniref:Uncharacterized protein n=1 Tax=Edhazardia aedis (strain USNM 41457) TaxID=1003232 RepID=J9D3M5_EDHAE|nr:hypothetical protein EDEG_03140 [Edhazardia aedis USNM 41457]|eukprot:EJW02436.1 hypothetical protein EDEG_03140 [Edhazardia aedis USNM 41457]